MNYSKIYARFALMACLAGVWLNASLRAGEAVAAETSATDVNLALAATPSASYVSGATAVAALNDGNTPENSLGRGTGS